MERSGYEISGEPFGREWIWYSGIFCACKIVLSVLLTSFLHSKRASKESINVSAVIGSENSEFLYLMDDD